MEFEKSLLVQLLSSIQIIEQSSKNSICASSASHYPSIAIRPYGTFGYDGQCVQRPKIPLVDSKRRPGCQLAASFMVLGFIVLYSQRRSTTKQLFSRVLMEIRGIRRKISKLFLRERNFDISYISLRSQPCPAQTFPQLRRVYSPSHGRFVTPRGYFPVEVGKKRNRFFVGISYLNHPLIRALLERSGEEFGIDQIGVLSIPCDLESSEHVLLLVQSDPNPSYETIEEVVKHML